MEIMWSKSVNSNILTIKNLQRIRSFENYRGISSVQTYREIPTLILVDSCFFILKLNLNFFPTALYRRRCHYGCRRPRIAGSCYQRRRHYSCKRRRIAGSGYQRHRCHVIRCTRRRWMGRCHTRRCRRSH